MMSVHLSRVSFAGVYPVYQRVEGRPPQPVNADPYLDIGSKAYRGMVYRCWRALKHAGKPPTCLDVVPNPQGDLVCLTNQHFDQWYACNRQNQLAQFWQHLKPKLMILFK